MTKSNGGLFTVQLFGCDSRLHTGEPSPLDGMTIYARGRGVLHKKGALLVGDTVEVSYDTTSFSTGEDGAILPSPDGTGIAIDRVVDRASALIRPPMANLNVIFVTFSVTSPEPVLGTVDRLICIAEHNGIEPVIVITKSELAPDEARKLEECYRRAGFSTFCVGFGSEEGVSALGEYIRTRLDGKIAAFSGASGVGKSTLLNRLFPNLKLETGEISRRIERGKNTTRCVELYPLSDAPDCGFLADTPGFTMLDFERFDFLELEDLPGAFREFRPYLGTCRFKKCTHTKEQGCAILRAVGTGEIAASRHESFLSLDAELRKKKKW